MKAAAHSKRMISAAEVAARLGRSRSWFYQRRADLERQGFPCPHPIVGRWDAHAVERWLDSSFDPTPSAKNDLEAAFGL
jgi:predicted DNA-binding transcriptional regulator AlpA